MWVPRGDKLVVIDRLLKDCQGKLCVQSDIRDWQGWGGNGILGRIKRSVGMEVMRKA